MVREGTLEQLQTIAELVKKCLNLIGVERPSMKEVAIELEGLRKFTKHPWVHQQAHEETVSLVSEKSDLYPVQTGPYSKNTTGQCSIDDNTIFPLNSPR